MPGILADNSAFWYMNMGSVPTCVCSLLGLILFSERAVVQAVCRTWGKAISVQVGAQSLGTSESGRK